MYKLFLYFWNEYIEKILEILDYLNIEVENYFWLKYKWQKNISLEEYLNEKTEYNMILYWASIKDSWSYNQIEFFKDYFVVSVWIYERQFFNWKYFKDSKNYEKDQDEIEKISMKYCQKIFTKLKYKLVLSIFENNGYFLEELIKNPENSNFIYINNNWKLNYKKGKFSLLWYLRQ